MNLIPVIYALVFPGISAVLIVLAVRKSGRVEDVELRRAFRLNRGILKP